MQNSQPVWESYWGERQKSLQNPQGKRKAVTAAFQLLKELAERTAQPVRIIELGCGEGHVLAELLKMCVAQNIAVKDCVGVDNQAQVIKNARLLYPQINFLAADYGRQPLDLVPFDLVMLIGTLHEVYSSNHSISRGQIDHERGSEAVARALCYSASLVLDDGYMVLFDGVEHKQPDLKLIVRFQSIEALDEFRKIAGEYEAFRLAYEELDAADHIRISMHDFTRYITKTRFVNGSLWEIEKRESYQYFNESEFRQHLEKLRFEVLDVQCASPHEVDWRKRVRIENAGGNFPKESILITAQKTIPKEKWPEHVAISIVSPGKDENEQVKNQDRIMLMEVGGGNEPQSQLAIVCDGVTPSPFADVAAEYVSNNLLVLFQEGGLRRTADVLREMRLSLLEKSLTMEAGQSRPGYQTTLVSVCIKRDKRNSPRMISIKALGSGDCALFIFRENGDLLYSNVNLNSGEASFRSDSPCIAVLPDCYDEATDNTLFDFVEYPENVQLLLCSDGLYNAFTNFKEIHDWLNEHRAELVDSTRHYTCLTELHDKLSRKNGDDDISFIWLQPQLLSPIKSRRLDNRGKPEFGHRWI
jgi:serine/threonine protein phosphatase PrpC/SAM-dependent methyltransferase